MDINGDINALIAELDRLRIARNMSYQQLADACGVSKSTIHRTLTCGTEPTMQLLQAIAAAVQYEPDATEEFPEDFSQDGYIAYLQSRLIQKDADHRLHVQQLHAHYNMLRRQDRREKDVWMVLAIVFALTFVALFLYDFANVDRGWIQRIYGVYQSAFSDAFLYVVTGGCTL